MASPSLDPLLRLAQSAEQLADAAEAALARGCLSQDAQAASRIRSRALAFRANHEQLRRTLDPLLTTTSDDNLTPRPTPAPSPSPQTRSDRANT